LINSPKKKNRSLSASPEKEGVLTMEKKKEEKNYIISED
jgi:hypothetical protein